MKNLFIPHVLASIAKEKLFKEKCFARWIDSVQLDYDFAGTYPFDQVPAYLPAPMYQQIIDWFREKHNIDFLLGKDFGEYSFEVHCGDDYHYFNDVDYYKALDKAIAHAFTKI